MNAIKWNKEHKSECGRFWCMKHGRTGRWELYDKEVNRNDTRFYHVFRYLSDAKEAAERRMRK